MQFHSVPKNVQKYQIIFLFMGIHVYNNKKCLGNV